MNMKRLISFGAGVLLLSGCIGGPSQRIPFTGTRQFNFVGGEGTTQQITIKADGTTVVRFVSSASGGKPLMLYRGKYKNPIPVGDGMSYLIKGNKIYIVSKGKVEQDCKQIMENGEEKSAPCVSELK